MCDVEGQHEAVKQGVQVGFSGAAEGQEELFQHTVHEQRGGSLFRAASDLLIVVKRDHMYLMSGSAVHDTA